MKSLLSLPQLILLLAATTNAAPDANSTTTTNAIATVPDCTMQDLIKLWSYDPDGGVAACSTKIADYTDIPMHCTNAKCMAFVKELKDHAPVCLSGWRNLSDTVQTVLDACSLVSAASVSVPTVTLPASSAPSPRSIGLTGAIISIAATALSVAATS